MLRYVLISLIMLTVCVFCHGYSCQFKGIETEGTIDGCSMAWLNLNLHACSSNGTIIIGQWMRDLCESEDELAAIVAHEKAHLVLKHGEKAWYEKVGGWFTGWFVDESKPRFRGPPDPKSVARENEADAKGLMLMAEAGYDPQAAVSFWTRYYERTGWWEGDGTHPKPRERLAHLNALMPKAKELYMVTKNHYHPIGMV